MPASDLQGAIDLAARLLDDIDVRKPPVSSAVICFVDPSREVRVVLEPMVGRARGATTLSPDGKQWWIVLNANDRSEVRRFTLAHEAFHIACGAGMASRRDQFGKGYECSLADHFASHLLVPDRWLEGLIRPEASWVARRCQVSQTVARLRLEAMRRPTFASHTLTP